MSNCCQTQCYQPVSCQSVTCQPTCYQNISCQPVQCQPVTCQTQCLQLESRCPQYKCYQLTQHSDIDRIYNKFSNTLEGQLKKKYEEHTQQIDRLNKEIFQLKNHAMRLQIRNKRDLQAENELRKQYNLLLQKYKQKQSHIIKEVEIVERIKQVPVDTQNDQLENQLALWKTKANQHYQQYQKAKMERDLFSNANLNSKIQINKLQKDIDTLKEKLSINQKTIQQKDRIIQKLNTLNTYLKNTKQVITETKHLFPQFRQPEKVRTVTKIQTVYAERPVQKIVFVDVLKRVKQFVQPQRAFVNRIISCEQKDSCKCQQKQDTHKCCKLQVNNLCSVVDNLENNIISYKSERQNLANIIHNKDSELRSLESKIRLIGVPARAPAEPRIKVVVSKQRNQLPQIDEVPAKNIPNKNQKPTVRK